MTGPAITKAELFARLAEGHAAGVTVVTPNRRLAQVLRAEFDTCQTVKGLSVWEDADILPLDAFVSRSYEDALYSEKAASGGEPLPLLLAPAQERALWEEAVRGSKWAGALLDVPRTATEAMQAWRLAHDWGIARTLDGADGNEDARAFVAWAKAYARRLRRDGMIDAAQLLDVPFEARKPRLLVGYAFDIVPRQVQALFDRHQFRACRPAQGAGDPGKCSFPSPKAELEAAASWARAQLEAGIERGKSPRIGIVVPGLEQRRREVARVFARIFGHGTGSAAPFNVSLGEPLAAYPIVGFALSLLEFTTGELEFEKVSRILRSPFLGGGETEAAARALADARLRRQAPARLSLPRLIALMDGRSGLRSVLEAVFGKAREGEGRTRSPHDWAQHCTELLAAAGFPGERALDSAEYQARARFNEVLGEFGALGLVNPGMSRQEAVGELRRLCAEATFQPESAAAPVQVLGLLESAGVEFDALWVSGLTDERWPIRASPSPFLPLALQRAAGIPEASADSALALDARITAGWAAASPATVFSWARREEDRDLLPSPLIAGMPERKPEVPEYDSHRNRIFRSGKLETLEDPNAPSLPSAAVHGGTRVLADQAACPFRAYARHRLRAEALPEPAPGPDAMQRGQLLHALMAGIWRELKTQECLDRDVSQVVAAAAENAVKESGIEHPFAPLEVERLKKLAGEWLQLERARPPFAVVAVEKKVELALAGLELRGRVDRVDRLADGTHAVIDYKTGARVTPKDWDGERPDDPQLPLYAVTAKEPVSAVAFAKLRAGDMKFLGFGSEDEAIPGVRAAKSWPGLLAGWKEELESLARGFAAGAAAVDPKHGLATCRNCDLQTLCRVHERLDALGADEEEQ